MLSVLIEAGAEDAEALARTLAALVPGLVDGLVRDAVVIVRGEGPAVAVAEAAGARVLDRASPAQAVAAARSDCLLLLEPGARPLEGWIEPVRIWTERSSGPARFSVEGRLGSLFRRPRALRAGLLLPWREAEIAARTADGLEALARGRAARRLTARLLPAKL